MVSLVITPVLGEYGIQVTTTVRSTGEQSATTCSIRHSHSHSSRRMLQRILQRIRDSAQRRDPLTSQAFGQLPTDVQYPPRSLAMFRPGAMLSGVVGGFGRVFLAEVKDDFPSRQAGPPYLVAR